MLDALGIEPPATIRGVTQAPIEGVSFAHTFDDGRAETSHHTQYFEMFGHRPSTTTDGARSAPGRVRASPRRRRRAATTAARSTGRCWPTSKPTTGSCTTSPTDYAETNNVAAEHRDKVIEMVGRWWAEAGKYNVMPIDGSMLERMNVERPAMPPRTASSITPVGQWCRSRAAPSSTTGRSASLRTCRSPRAAPKVSSSHTVAGWAATRFS